MVEAVSRISAITMHQQPRGVRSLVQSCQKDFQICSRWTILRNAFSYSAFRKGTFISQLFFIPIFQFINVSLFYLQFFSNK